MGAVYRVAWCVICISIDNNTYALLSFVRTASTLLRHCRSSDSRMLTSASKDSTIKLWEVNKFKNAKATLPGHADEVYALDWSPFGQQVASGSKDRTIKVWR